MCTGLEIAAIAGTALSAHSAIEASNARSDAKAERNKLAAEAKQAQAEAAQGASAQIAMRKRVYPRWVENGKMSPQKAARETATMEAVLRTLLREKEKGRLL